MFKSFLTKKILSDASQNRYAEFSTVVRVWVHLAAVRRSGQAHDIDTVITHLRSGSLAIRCPACPQIGINVTKETIELATDDEK